MLFKPVEIHHARPEKLSGIAFAALKSDEFSDGIKNTLAQVEFAENFSKIPARMQEEVIRANLKALEERIQKLINSLKIKKEPIDEILTLGHLRLISKYEAFDCISEELRDQVFQILQKHNVE